jgi:hypothetical protein
MSALLDWVWLAKASLATHTDSRRKRESYNVFVTLTPKLRTIFILFSSIKVQITGPAIKVENLVKYNTNPKESSKFH